MQTGKFKDIYEPWNHRNVHFKKLTNSFVFRYNVNDCRVLGRYLDTWINECRKIAKHKNYKFIISEFITTEK